MSNYSFSHLHSLEVRNVDIEEVPPLIYWFNLWPVSITILLVDQIVTGHINAFKLHLYSKKYSFLLVFKMKALLGIRNFCQATFCLHFSLGVRSRFEDRHNLSHLFHFFSSFLPLLRALCSLPLPPLSLRRLCPRSREPL